MAIVNLWVCDAVLITDALKVKLAGLSQAGCNALGNYIDAMMQSWFWFSSAMVQCIGAVTALLWCSAMVQLQ